MIKNRIELSERFYDLEMDFEKIVMLSQIIKNFGDFSNEVSNSTEKMQYLAELLCHECNEFKGSLSGVISEFSAKTDNIKDKTI